VKGSLSASQVKLVTQLESSIQPITELEGSGDVINNITESELVFLLITSLLLVLSWFPSLSPPGPQQVLIFMFICGSLQMCSPPPPSRPSSPPPPVGRSPLLLTPSASPPLAPPPPPRRQREAPPSPLRALPLRTSSCLNSLCREPPRSSSGG